MHYGGIIRSSALIIGIELSSIIILTPLTDTVRLREWRISDVVHCR